MRIEDDTLIIEDFKLESKQLIELLEPYKDNEEDLKSMFMSIIRVGIITMITELRKKEIEQLEKRVDDLYAEIRKRVAKDLEARGITDPAEIEKQVQLILEQASQSKNKENAD